MGHHYTRSTVEAQEYCNRCNKQTMHQVFDRRLANCLECMKRNNDSIKNNVKAPEDKQESLFGKP